MIQEITAKKYSEKTGIAFTTVKKYCREGFLECRKIKHDGTEVKDFTKEKRGTWFVNTAVNIKTNPLREKV